MALARQAPCVSPPPPFLPPLIFFTDPARTPRPWDTVPGLPAGAAVVLRAFGASDAEEQGWHLRRACDGAGVKLLVGRDDELARAVRADGLHLPERDISRALLIREKYPHWLVTGAVHQAQTFGAAGGLHAAIVSPVFTAGGRSASKAALGIDDFTRMVAAAPCPVYALGGITAANVGQLSGTGACGIAGVDAFRTAFAG